MFNESHQFVTMVTDDRLFIVVPGGSSIRGIWGCEAVYSEALLADWPYPKPLLIDPYAGLPTVTEFQYFVKEMRPWVRKFFLNFGSKYWNFLLYFYNYRVKILKFGEMLLKILKL